VRLSQRKNPLQQKPQGIINYQSIFFSRCQNASTSVAAQVYFLERQQMSRFENGWIKFYRKAIEGDIGSNGYLLAIWTTLLSWATVKETTVLWEGKPRKVPPGSVVCGMQELADQLKFSKTTVYKWVHYLQKRESISLEARTQGSLITICNWEQYQISEEGRERKKNAGLTRREHDATLIEEVKNKEVKKGELKGVFTPSNLEFDLEIENGNGQQRENNSSKFIAVYVKAYQKRWGSNVRPQFDGKTLGQIREYLKSVPIERACNLIEVFCQMDQKWFNTKMHDFSTFVNNQNPIAYALDSGTDTGNSVNLSHPFWVKEMELEKRRKAKGELS
jgi:hypothetical protein